MVNPRISVVICTYNGLMRLGPTLEAVAKCRQEFPVEVLIVDNNSSDGTADFACRIWDAVGSPGFSFKIVIEPLPGLSAARRAGVQAASGEILIFCDDDNLLAEDYLSLASTMMTDRSIAALGGAGDPVFETDPSPHVWNILPWLACGAQYVNPNDLDHEMIDMTWYPWRGLYGAGLTVRRDDLRKLYQVEDFPLLSGRVGTALTSGEDIEIVHALALGGGRVVSAPALRFKHLIPPSRTTPAYFQGLMEKATEARRVTELYIALRTWKQKGSRLFSRRDCMSAFLALVRPGRNRKELFAMLCAFRVQFLMTPMERRVWKIFRSLPAFGHH